MPILLRLYIAVACLLVTPLLRAQGEPLMLGVSEGTSGGLDHARAVAKYGALAEVLGHALKREVRVVFTREFAMLEDGMVSGRLDLVMARPSDYPARAMRDLGYQYVASAKPEGQCLIITAKDSALKTLADAKGKRWVLPEQVSYMSKFCIAELRDRGIVMAQEKVQWVREQGAVPFFIDNGFAEVGGIASYSGVAKMLAQSGHRVLHASVPQPYFPLVASRSFTPAQLQAMQKALASLPQNDAGRDVLKTIGIQGFDIGTSPNFDDLIRP